MFKHLIIFSLGGIFYLMIEMLWRGYSHWSMFVLGGACFLIIGLINEHSRGKIILPVQMIIGASTITILEFIVGYIVNIKLGLDVWSYYDMPYNIMGQVCLPYMILWLFLSLGCIFVDDYLRCRLFGEEKQKYKWF